MPTRQDDLTLRQRAEVKLSTLSPANLESLAPDQAQQLLHELQVHQIELEMQNEELHRIQDDLEIARARYFDLYDLAPVGYLTLNEHGLITEANLAAAKLFGANRSELVKQPFSRFILLEDQEQYYLGRRNLLSTSAPQVWDLRIQRPATSDLLWAHVEMTLGRVSETQSPVCRVTVSDMTAQKRAEHALRAERNLLRTVIDTAPGQVFAKDLGGRYVIYNRATAQRMGTGDPQMLIGKTDWEVYPAEIAAAYSDDDQYVIVTDQALRREESAQNPDGTLRWVMVSRHPWRDPTGQVMGVVGMTTDLTERKEMERQLQSVNQKLNTEMAQLRGLEAQLREQAIRDPLTQLYNRRYLNETFPREIALALRQKYTIGVLMLDLDRFKAVNDTFGHLAGDETLQTIARTLTTYFRASDIVCRYGGEEFLCLLMNATQEFALQRAEQLCAAIANLLAVPAHPTMRVTASIGVALLPTHGSDPVAILKAADAAMYQAKLDGRNCVRLAQLI